MHTVFKVDLHKGTEQSGERPFIPRRIHRKSRRGCLACKERRIKCDETKPQCSKCSRAKTECIYRSSTTSSPESAEESSSVEGCNPMSLTADLHSMSVDLVKADLDGLLTCISSPTPLAENFSPVRVLQHFQEVTCSTIGTNPCRSMFHSIIGKKSWDNLHLMHMVLAVSSAHLKRLHADAGHIKLYQQYSIIEATHWQRGLQLYQKLLQKQSKNPHFAALKPDFDATIATTFLTIVFTFALDDDTPLDAYTDGDEEKLRHAINPLAVTQGFPVLRGVFGEDVFETGWKAVLSSSDDSKGTYSNSTQRGIEGLPPAFVDLCDLDDDSTTECNEYHHIVCLLAPLLQLHHDLDSFTKLMAFSGRTWAYFRPLVLRKDPRGLLLLSYWFALLRQLDQWWMTRRAKTECMAIVNYLSGLRDPKITALLPFPASFGSTDLSYIWNLPEKRTDSAAIFEQDFGNATGRKC